MPREVFECAYGGLPKWQPMETAPKDGSEVALLICEGGQCKSALVGFWDEGWVVFVGDLYFVCPGDPVGWYPLPDHD